jgi:hypothetical protein
MSLVTRVLTAALAVGATGVLAAGVVDPGALATGAGFVAAEQPGASRVGLGGLPSTLVCPPAPRLQAEVDGDAEQTDEDFRADGDTEATTTVRAVAASGATGAAALAGRTLPADPAAAEALTGEGTVLAAVGTGSQEPVVVVADPALLVAGLQVTRTGSGDLAGLAASSCTAPAETSWLVGGAVEPGRSGRVLLSNPTATAASVDLTVLTPEGAVTPPAGQDLAVAAGATREVLLEGLLPPTTALAVGVSARGAAVAAALVDTDLAGVRAQGVEHVAATRPGTDLSFPGVLAGTRTTTLRLANPGEEPAAVGWQVLGADGAVVLAGEAVVTVPAGTAVDVPLDLTRPDGSPEPGPVTVRVGSDQPVVGAVQLTWDRPGDRSERAWVAPAPAVTAEALALVPQDGVRTFLGLSSDRAAQVAVLQLDADGEALAEELVLDVAPGTTLTRAVEAEDADDEVAALRLRVVSGQVHAALSLTADAPGAQTNTFFAVVPVQVPPPTTDEVTVAPLPEDLLRDPAGP